MPTKLSRYADGVMEAAWLGAILLTPVFFNIYSSRIFEPDKLTLLRTLALVILAAWTVKLFEQGGFRWERLPQDGGPLKALARIPLILPAAFLALVYIVATVFSVTPYTSLWGSYQRLQGTLSTFAYLIVFASMVANLRRRGQVERLITVAILASLPVSLYGILQRYHADPIPWGGDTSGRIAANLGNSIFVAAYLIMTLPLALMRTIESFEAMLVDRGHLWPNFARATAYVFTLVLQLIAIYFSGSRGPWLGLGVALIFVWLGLSLIWRKRWLTISGVVLALLAGGFLVLLNIPNGPLESLRARPELSRLSQLLDAESRTGRVRTLIWQGASELVRPHEPLEYPDGRKDPFNALRPLIGYGPEGMYVAYNRFYPPELTQVEKRNASPDRSHNETWDSLVITGVLGLAAYLTLFGSLLYFGLKWLGLVPGKKERNLYLALYLGGGALSAIFFIWWGGLKYLGVALPFGMVLGVTLYMILISLFGRVQASVSETQRLRAYVMLGLLAGVIAHFVEINFGIAIAATRTYFWAYAGLLLLVGVILPLHGELFKDSVEASTPQDNPANAAEEKPQTKAAPGGSAKKNSPPQNRRKPTARRPVARKTGPMIEPWIRSALIAACIVGLLLTTLGYEFVSNASREPSASGLVWASLTSAPRAGGRNGVLPLLFTTWLIGVLLLSSESVRLSAQNGRSINREWLKIVGLSAALSLVTAYLFWLWNAAGLVALSRESAKTVADILGQVQRSEGILTLFYIQTFLLLFAAAVFLPLDWPVLRLRQPVFSPLLATGLITVAFAFSSYANLRVIQADIAFKTGDLFARPDSWPAAISIYNHANQLAPNEDYYYLFLGRAYLEYAKTLSDTAERERLIEQAASDLRKAQEINPLNTDHTANLARLHSLWASFSEDPELREQRIRLSEGFFEKAVMLSPNSARLWDEWAVLYLNLLDQPEKALERLEQALLLDPFYDWTYALLGDVYSKNIAEQASISPEEKSAALQKAAEYYTQAMQLGQDSAAPSLLYNYAIALGGIYAQLNQMDQAALAYERALEILPESSDRWRVQITLAQILAQLGELPRALEFAQAALAGAPEDQKLAISTLISQLGGQP